MSAAFHFKQLTPDLMLDALQSVQLYPTSGLQPLNSYENRVYQFKTDDQQKVVVKFYRPERWTDGQILEEHQFISELQSAGLPVIAPKAFAGETLLHWQDYRFSIFPGVFGRPFVAEQLDDYAALGELTGRLHAIGRGRRFLNRPALDIAADIAAAIEQILPSALLPATLYHDYQQVLQQLLQLVSSRSLTFTPIRLHGDLHAGNLLATPTLQLLDFDDCQAGPAIQDCWLSLHGEAAAQQLQLDVFLNEYQNYCDFDWSELALLEPLRCRRQLTYLAWLVRRWADPAFVQHFPWLAEASFWQQQLLTLRQQAQQLSDAPAKRQPRADNFGNC